VLDEVGGHLDLPKVLCFPGPFSALRVKYPWPPGADLWARDGAGDYLPGSRRERPDGEYRLVL
jgi:hypothetical protein